MVPRNWTIVLAVGLALVLGATALGQGGQLAGLVQPQVVSIEQLVPVDVTLAVPLDDGSVVTATAPITVGISLQVKIDGAGVVSVAASKAEPETVTTEAAAEPPAADAGADFVDGSGVPYTVETDLPVSVTSVTSSAMLETMGSIVGEVRNDGDEELGTLQLSVRLYDADGKVLGLGTGYTTKDAIQPGGSSAFSVMAMANLDDVASYAIEVSD